MQQSQRLCCIYACEETIQVWPNLTARYWQGLTWSRRVSARSTRLRHPNIYDLTILLPQLYYNIHTYHKDPGYCHSRSIQEPGRSVLPGCDSGRSDRSGCGLSCESPETRAVGPADISQTLLPRLDILQEVWRGARKCLYSNNPKPG